MFLVYVMARPKAPGALNRPKPVNNTGLKVANCGQICQYGLIWQSRGIAGRGHVRVHSANALGTVYGLPAK